MAVFEPSVFSPSVFDAASDPNMAASGSFVLAGVASLQLTVSFEAVGAFAVTGAAALTTEITMAAAGEMALAAGAALRTARTGGRLAECGHVLAADRDQWLLDPFL